MSKYLDLTGLTRFKGKCDNAYSKKLYMHYLYISSDDISIKIISSSATPITTYQQLASYANTTVSSTNNRNQIIRVSYEQDLGYGGYSELGYENFCYTYEVTSSNITIKTFNFVSKEQGTLTTSGAITDIVEEI